MSARAFLDNQRKLTEMTISVPIDVHMFPGLPHGFRRVLGKLSESARWDRVIEQGIAWALSKPTATGIFEIKSK